MTIRKAPQDDIGSPFPPDRHKVTPVHLLEHHLLKEGHPCPIPKPEFLLNLSRAPSLLSIP